jgi:hypothetical protein
VSGVIRWESPPEWRTLPLFDELHAQPLRWAVIWEEGAGTIEEMWELQKACRLHPRIKCAAEQRHQLRPDGGDSYYCKALRAVYIPYGESWDVPAPF